MEPARSAIGKWGIVVGGIGLTLGAAVSVAGLVQARPGSYLTVEGRETMRLERHGGWGRRHGDAGWSRFCNGEGAAHVNGLIGFLEGYLALGPGQAEAWQGLTEALRRGQASVEAACGSPAPPAENPAAAQLARAEALLAASLDVVRTMRPALAEFYASLTGAQRAALDALLAGYGRP